MADGAESNWKFLSPHTEEQILDFYHASGYLGIVAEVLYPKQLVVQKEWLKDSCHPSLPRKSRRSPISRAIEAYTAIASAKFMALPERNPLDGSKSDLSIAKCCSLFAIADNLPGYSRSLRPNAWALSLGQVLPKSLDERHSIWHQ